MKTTTKYVTNVITITSEIKVIEFCEVIVKNKKTKKSTMIKGLDKFVG